MRRLVIAAACVAALASASVAVARGFDNQRSVTSISGTFTATSVANTRTHTCTTTDGKTFVTTSARYTGTSTGTSDLAGDVRIDARSAIDTTDGLGVVDGTLRVSTSGHATVARFDGVYDHGTLSGLAVGHGARRPTQLLANLSASFSATGGFTNGKLGGGSAGGSAVELGPARCAPAKPVRQSNEARGSVSAVSSTSITVAGVTCAVPPSLAARVGGLEVGDRVDIRCSVANGIATLVRVQTTKR